MPALFEMLSWILFWISWSLARSSDVRVGQARLVARLLVLLLGLELGLDLLTATAGSACR